MYIGIINKELGLDIYEKFIDYAIKESDAFMLVTYRDTGNVEEMFYVPPSRRAFLSEELRLIALKSDEEAKKRKYIDIDTFCKKTEPFLEKLSPYLTKKRNRPTEWPGIKTSPSKYQTIDICTYKVCNEVRESLLEPKGLFNWKYPYFPDDLSFFKSGYCWFFTVAHEKYACVYRDNLKDIRILENIGIKFLKIEELNMTREQLFHENY